MSDKKVNTKNPPTGYKDKFERLQRIANGEDLNVSSTSGATGDINYNSPVGDSKYDKGLISSIDLDPENIGKSLQEYRARKQPVSHQIANATVKLVPNIVLGTIGTVASALDVEDYFNSDQEVGNWLTDLTTKGQDSFNETFKIYRANPGQALDLDDSGWWVSSLASLAESMGSFAIGGMGLAKGIGMAGTGLKALAGLSRSAKVAKIANAITKTNAGIKATEGVQTTLNAAMLNQAEGILEAMDVQEEIYNKYVDELGEEGARKKAAEAAATVVSTNRINILLNLSSANLFFKGSKFTRRVHNIDSAKKNLGRGATEGIQESAEEIINLIAGSRGRAYGNDEEYTARDIINDITSMEALEAAVLGFAGGMGQTVLTTEGVNRLMKTGDPDNPGKKISVKEFNNKQYEKYQQHISEIESTDVKAAMNTAANQMQINKALIDFDKKSKNLREQGKVKEAEKVEKEADTLRNTLVDVQAFDAFQKGTADHLIKLYEDISNGPQKEGFPDNYKELAQKQKEKIRDLEKTYNKAMLYENGFAVYVNRAGKKGFVQDLKEHKATISEAESDLADAVNRLTEDTDYSSEELFFFQDEKRIKEDEKFAKVSNEIKDTEEYQEYLEAKEGEKILKDEISRLDREYKSLTNPKAQEKAKKQKEQVAEKIRKRQQEQSEKVEAEARKKQEQEAKNKKIKEQKEKEKEISKQKKEVEKNNKLEYDNIIKNYNIGEQVPIPPNSPEDTQDQEATLHEVDEENGVIILAMVDGSHLELHRDDNTTKQISAESAEADYSSEGGQSAPLKQPKPDTNEGEQGGAKLIARRDDGTPLTTNNGIAWVEEQYPEYLEYEREPRNKKEDKVGFRINTENVNKLSEDRKQAFITFKKHENEGTLKDIKKGSKVYKDLADHLSILAVFGEDILAPMEARPNPDHLKEGDTAMQNFEKHTLPLREAILDQLIAGTPISEIEGSVQGQYKGLLQIEPNPEKGKAAENNILDLHAINGDIDKVDILMVNSRGNLVDKAGNIKSNTIHGHGEIYMYIPMANGQPYPLKLNVRKLVREEAEVLYELYRMRMNEKDTSKLTMLKEMPQEQVDFIEERIAPVLDVIAKQKRRKDITIKEITDFLVWDGTDNDKTKIKLEGSKLLLGDQEIFGDKINTVESKDKFIKFLTETKRHHIKFKMKKNDVGFAEMTASNRDYIEYLVKNKILNTNAVVGEPTFQHRTHVYLNPELKNGKPKQKETPVQKAAKTGKSEADIRQEIEDELAPLHMKYAEQFMEDGMDLPDAHEAAENKLAEKRLQLEKERLGLSSEVAPEPEIEPEVIDKESIEYFTLDNLKNALSEYYGVKHPEHPESTTMGLYSKPSKDELYDYNHLYFKNIKEIIKSVPHPNEYGHIKKENEISDLIKLITENIKSEEKSKKALKSEKKDVSLPTKDEDTETELGKGLGKKSKKRRRRERPDKKDPKKDCN